MSDPRRRVAADTAAELIDDLEAFRLAVNRYAYRGLAGQTFDIAVFTPSATDRTLNQVDQLHHDQARIAARRLVSHIASAYTTLRRTLTTPMPALNIADRLYWLHHHLTANTPIPRRTLDSIARHLNAARVTQLGQTRTPHPTPPMCNHCSGPLGSRPVSGLCTSCDGFRQNYERLPTRRERDRFSRTGRWRIHERTR